MNILEKHLELPNRLLAMLNGSTADSDKHLNMYFPAEITGTSLQR
jgi:hypothetical protein